MQAALRLPELKVVKPSDMRWLSHERCMRAILKDLPAIITTLQQLYETSGDAEAFGLCTFLASFCGILSEVLDILARMNASMQKKTADYSRLQVILDVTLDDLKSLKNDGAEWSTSTDEACVKLENEYGFEIGRHSSGSVVLVPQGQNSGLSVM